MKPVEFWDLTLIEFFDLLEAFVEEEKRQDDMKNQRVSWFTSHIMNSSGNYKRAIKPEDLYKPIAQLEENNIEQEVIERFESPEQKEAYLKNLLESFGKNLEGELKNGS